MIRVLRSGSVLVLAALLAACSGGPWSTMQPGHPLPTTTTGAAAPVVVSVPTVLILDASGSMTTPDAPGPRIDAAKAAAKSLVAALPDDATLGLTTYGTGTDSSDAARDAGCRDVTTLVPLGTLDRNALNAKIDSLNPSGYTPISLALEQAAALLPAGGDAEAIVLVSDGEDTCGRPPCDVAAQLHRDHPGLAISTVGFRTDGPASDQLSCIAHATGGLYVQAANSAQLAARLLATQNVQAAKATLSSTGLAGVDLGTSAVDIRRSNADFPDVAASGRVVVVWRDCDFTFVDGVLDSIAPHNGGRTIDGVAVGSNVSDAIKFYGNPVGNPTKEGALDWLIFTADESLGSSYRMGVDGYGNSGTNSSGTIKQIVLCRCQPKPAPSVPVATDRGYGPVSLGMTKDQAISALGNAVGEIKQSASCIVIAFSTPTGNATALVKGNGVVVIDTPPRTVTDRGVGDGSSTSQLHEAYERDHSVQTLNTQAGQSIFVTTGDPSSVGNGNPGGLIGFAITNGDTIGPPEIGGVPGFEYCSG